MDVSVIIPVYNTEKYLKRCVDSILAQQDIAMEIILVDDGSTDTSPQICDRYAADYHYIHVLHIKNSGPATAKNEGMKIAVGDYIALTDSDDKMKPTMLSEMVHAARSHHADIACCNYMQTDESGHISHTQHTGETISLNHEQGLIHLLGKDKIYSQCWTKIYRRDFLTSNGIMNENGLRTEEDFIFNIKAFCKCEASVIIDKPLYIYTHREKSLAHNYFRQHISQFIDNRILRVNITDNLIKAEPDTIIEWGYAHNIMYFNELIGKVALFPDFYQDKRIQDIFGYIRHHRDVLQRHLDLCGFSKFGAWLLLYLPIGLYMRYRNSKTS
jgi:glycosyltransferase involved in cell wall biosynthesis